MLVVRTFAKDRPSNAWRKGLNKPKHEARLSRYLKMLQDKYSAEVIIDTPEEKCVYFFFSQFILGCKIQVQCTLIPSLNQISFVSQIYKDGRPVKIKSQPLTLLLCRLCNKINKDSKYYMTQINILTRIISIRQSTVYTASQFVLYTNNDKISEEYLEREINGAKVCLLYNFPLLMDLMGQPQYIQNARRCEPRFHWQREDEGIQEYLERLGKILLACQKQAAFMHLPNLKKNIKKDESEIEQFKKDDIERAKNIVNNQKNDDQIRDLMTYYTESPDVNYVLPNPLNTFPDCYTSWLVMKEYRASSENTFLMQKIIIPDDVVWNPIFNEQEPTNYQQTQVTINFQLEKMEDLMSLKMTKEQAAEIFARFQTRRISKPTDTTNRKLAMKIISDQERTLHEKRILSQLLYCCSQFISRSYFTTSGPYSDKLFVDYEQEGSIDQYCKKNKKSLTILSKLFMLQLTCQGLRYLHDQNIFKIQLKRSDVLVSKGLISKLRNFSAAHHQKSKFHVNKTTVQLPYCCPEIFMEECSNITEKQDVFCLGVIMCQVLFETNVFSISSSTLEECFSNGDYFRRILMCPERLNDLGPEECMQKLGRILLKCLSPNPEDRPCVDWLFIFLKECIAYFNTLY